MKTRPHGPTIASMTPAIDGVGSAARSGRSRIPYENIVTSTSRQSDAEEAEHGRRADVVAIPRVARIDARPLDADEHEHRQQHRVAHLAGRRPTGSARPPPQKLSAKMSALKPAMTTTMKIEIGTILATVAIVLSAAACLTPRSTRMCTAHRSTEAAPIANGVDAVAEDRKELAQRRLDQDQAGDRRRDSTRSSSRTRSRSPGSSRSRPCA